MGNTIGVYKLYTILFVSIVDARIGGFRIDWDGSTIATSCVSCDAYACQLKQTLNDLWNGLSKAEIGVSKCEGDIWSPLYTTLLIYDQLKVFQMTHAETKMAEDKGLV